MKVLITGGAGFIGSNLTDRLCGDGHKVIVVDNLIDSHIPSINSQATFIELDVSDPRLSDVFEKEKPDVVYYLSGPIHLRKDINDPLFKKSLGALEDLRFVLDNSLKVSVKKFVLVSSGGAIYGGTDVFPTPETYKVHPDSEYGLMNLKMEELLNEYSSTHELPSIILRLSNVYGPRQWESGIIPSFVRKILKQQAPVINGDGSATRDFVFIDDVVDALLLAMNTKKTGIFNVGSAKEISIKEVFKNIAEYLDWKGDAEYRTSSYAGVSRNSLDYSKIKQELGWEPKVTFSQGLQKTIDFLK